LQEIFSGFFGAISLQKKLLALNLGLGDIARLHMLAFWALPEADSIKA